MSEGDVVKAIPFTAWEQAVFVGLFIVLIALILFWVSRENKINRQFQQSESAAREIAQAARDAEWRLFLQQQRENDNQVSEAVKSSLDALTAITRQLVQEVQGQRADFQAHDQKEWAKLDEMSSAIHSPRKSTRSTRSKTDTQ